MKSTFANNHPVAIFFNADLNPIEHLSKDVVNWKIC